MSAALAKKLQKIFSLLNKGQLFYPINNIELIYPRPSCKVELVQDFDRLCEEIITAYIRICRNYCITEEEILMPKTIKVSEPVG